VHVHSPSRHSLNGTQVHIDCIMLGTCLGWFEINLQFCWPSPKAVFSTWYIFATIVLRMDALPQFFFLLLSSQFWPMRSKSRQGLVQLPVGGSTLSVQMDC